jgi:hypothetical protein
MQTLLKKITGESWFPGLTLKTLLNWDLYWNKYTLYIKIEAVLNHYYIYAVHYLLKLPKAFSL